MRLLGLLLLDFGEALRAPGGGPANDLGLVAGEPARRLLRFVGSHAIPFLPLEGVLLALGRLEAVVLLVGVGVEGGLLLAEQVTARRAGRCVGGLEPQQAGLAPTLRLGLARVPFAEVDDVLGELFVMVGRLQRQDILGPLVVVARALSGVLVDVVELALVADFLFEALQGLHEAAEGLLLLVAACFDVGSVVAGLLLRLAALLRPLLIQQQRGMAEVELARLH